VDFFQMPIYDIDIMRAIIDIDEDIDRMLKELARERGVSRAQMVREAIAQYLAGVGRPSSGAGFGVWRDRNIDGLAYERRLREDWPA
jgi:hypothetical protein